MSIGYGRTISDKAGNPAMAYDIAIHPTFLTKIDKSQTFKEFFITLVFEALEDKYNISLNRDDFCVLRHKKCMGSLQLHRIQQREINTTMNRKAPSLIEELPEGSSEFTEAIEEHKKRTSQLAPMQIPHYRFYRETQNDGVDCIIGQFKIPGMIYVRDLELDVGEDRVILTWKRNAGGVCRSELLFDKFFAFTIIQDLVHAKFTYKQRILTLFLPITTKL